MNRLEQQLQDHAGRIEAKVSPELATRLKRALARSRPEPARPGSMLPGLAVGAAMGALAVVTVWIVLQSPQRDQAPVAVTASLSPASMPGISRLGNAVDLKRAPEADLEAELTRLNADWQRIRNRVRDQIDPLL